MDEILYKWPEITYDKRFYRSNAWRRVRAYVIKVKGSCCQVCGAFCEQPIIHHVIYLPELPSTRGRYIKWLKVLCEVCHDLITRINTHFAYHVYFRKLTLEERKAIWRAFREWYKEKSQAVASQEAVECH